MTSYILDASTAAAWLLPARDEPLSASAIQIQRAYANGRIQLQAPDLILPELGSVLRKAMLRGRISEATAEDTLTRFLDFQVPVVPSQGLVALAFSIARARNASVYDGIYVALAAISQWPLLTADERLANQLSTYYPVQWLGAIAPSQY